MKYLRIMRKYLPLIAGLAILAVIGALAPWSKIGTLLGELKLETILALLSLSVVYYAAKALRFWYMLRVLGTPVPLVKGTLVYLSAQPVSLLPAGELYRTVLLEQYLSVPIRKSAPTVTLQGLIEAAVLLGFSMIAAFAIGRDRAAVLVIASLLALLLFALQQGWLSGYHAMFNRLPFVRIDREKYEKFIADHKKLLAPTSLLPLAALSVVPVLAGISIFYLAAHGIRSELHLAQAAIGYCLPVVLSGLSFLPGGVGVSEGGSIGLLHLFGVSAAAAIAITLLVRVFTLGAGLVFGLVATLIVHISMERR